MNWYLYHLQDSANWCKHYMVSIEKALKDPDMFDNVKREFGKQYASFENRLQKLEKEIKEIENETQFSTWR